MDPEIAPSALPSFTAPFHLLVDGGIILFYFAAILLIGLWFSQKDRKMSEFALGGRAVPWWAVMASIIAAETSAATYLGVPQEGYSKQSFAYVQLFAGLIIGRYLVGWFMIRPYYALRVFTVYDYVAIRFGPRSRNYMSILFLVMRTLASGTRLFIPSLVIVLAWQLFVQQQPVTEVSARAASNSVGPYFLAILALTVVTCAYTAIGGIKSVIWTEIVQASLMFGSALLAIGSLLYHLSDSSFNFVIGFNNLLAAVPQLATMEGYLITGFEQATLEKWMAAQGVETMSLWQYAKLILASDYTLFSAIIGATFGNMAAFGSDQAMVQRMLTAESLEKSRKSLITAALMAFPIAFVFSAIGILLFAFYEMYPETKPAAGSDVFPSYILGTMPVGVRGIVLAGVFATAMGSFAAALNSLATSATNDLYMPYFGKGRSEEQAVWVARVLTVVFAVLMIAIATLFAWAKVAHPDLRLIPVVLGIAGFILGPMLGVFLLGMVTKDRGSDLGNMVAITAGLLTTIVLSKVPFELIGQQYPAVLESVRWIPKVSFTWFAMIGAAVVFGVGLLFRTPGSVVRMVELRKQQCAAEGYEDTPLSLRGDMVEGEPQAPQQAGDQAESGSDSSR